MKRKILFFIVIFIANYLTAQNQSISGRFIDSTNNLNLENVSVMALNTADSILIGFARTNKSGAFELKNIQSKTVILMATSPGYADYIDRVEIQNNQLYLGNMNMIQMSQLIEAVFIKAQRGKMKIKGDTLIYLADSFKTKANATVEDLLKKLPSSIPTYLPGKATIIYTITFKLNRHLFMTIIHNY